MSGLDCERNVNREAWSTLNDEMVELTVLVPPNQMWTLEQAAEAQGISIGRLVRRALSQVSVSDRA